MAGCRIADDDPTSSSVTDWVAWHRRYDDPHSVVSRRLVLVQRALIDALDASPDGPVRLLSICAGDGRDVLGVLEHHARAVDVQATLVDLDRELVRRAQSTANALGLHQVRCVVGDAGLASWYEAARPLGLLVACGVFGNVSAADLEASLRAFGAVVATGGRVVWTRHRRPPDQTPQIRRWLDEAGFDEVSFDAVEGSLASVGCHRRAARAVQAAVPERLFRFVGDGSGAHT
jgi:ubiquinone/menaquinone biosynthesis C-methylase UbiE